MPIVETVAEEAVRPVMAMSGTGGFSCMFLLTFDWFQLLMSVVTILSTNLTSEKFGDDRDATLELWLSAT